MDVNANKRRFDISFLRKYFLILRASTRHTIRIINYERQHYSRGLGLKQNKRPGIAVIRMRIESIPIPALNQKKIN